MRREPQGSRLKGKKNTHFEICIEICVEIGVVIVASPHARVEKSKRKSRKVVKLFEARKVVKLFEARGKRIRIWKFVLKFQFVLEFVLKLNKFQN